MNTANAPMHNNIDALLKSHGIYPTPQRVAVAEMLFEKYQHLTADDVYDRVRRSANVSKATVYNTLALFSRKGLIREIVADPERIFYDSNTSRHHHFFNIDTGFISDIEPDAAEVPSAYRLPMGTVLHSIDLVVRVRNTPAVH